MGVPQGSILVPLLFNIFIYDIFYFMVNFEIANNADDLTPSSAKLDVRLVVDALEVSSSILFTWLKNNYMMANTDKNHLLLSGKNNLTAIIDRNVIESKDNQVLLDINIDFNLSFNKHINNLCKKANDRKSSFKELWRRDNPISIHHKILKVLATEIFKIKNIMKFSMKFSRAKHHYTIYEKTQAFMSEKYIQSITALNQYHF